MALSIPMDQGNGIIPTYHRITALHITLDPPRTVVMLTSFMAKTQSDVGPQKAAGPSFNFTFDGYPAGIDFPTIQTFIETQIKKRPEWAAAAVVA